MKKVIVFFILAIAVGAVFLAMRQEREKLVKEPEAEERVVKEEAKEPARAFNLTEPERHTLTINGEEHTFLLARYDPPFFHTRLLASREEQDLSTPEGTELALRSAFRRDRDWFLSLQDEGRRELILKRDQETDGRLLEERYRGKPLPDPVETGTYLKFIFRVDIEHEGKRYAIIQYRSVFEGIEEPHRLNRSFVKEGDVWLVTRDLIPIWHPVRRLVGLKTYEEIREILKEGTWDR